MGQRKSLKRNNISTKVNEKSTYQNLWDIAKAMLREKFIASNTYIRKKDKINNVSFHLNKLFKKEKIKSKVGKKIIIKLGLKSMTIKIVNR